MKLHGLITVAVAGLFAGHLPAVPDPGAKKDQVKSEIKKLEGTWDCYASEMDGQQSSAEEVKGWGLKVVFKGTKFTTLNPGNLVLMSGTYKIDPKKKPKTLEFRILEGQNKGTTQVGIYELQGDTLKLNCSRPGRDNRPTSFTTKPNTGHKITVFKREKS
jgi:uncharacterized protein (TIGR03067 family)